MAPPPLTAAASLGASELGQILRGWRRPIPGPPPPPPPAWKSCNQQQWQNCRDPSICISERRDRIEAGYNVPADFVQRCQDQLDIDCRMTFGCPTGFYCRLDGASSICCPAGLTNCSGDCRTLSSDVANCGACGVSCVPGQLCCSGVCRNPLTDSQNCGRCGGVCTAGRICQGGVCVCQPGLTDCGGTCRNLATDSGNCGACGHVCTGGRICQGGVCVCQPGLTDCGGTCRNLATDSGNCGACGNLCTAGSICCAGQCKDRTTDVANCGTCGKVCPTTCSGLRECVNGVCRNPTNYLVFVTNPCLSSLTVAAFTEAEAVMCAQQQFPGRKVGVPSTVATYWAQIWCNGYSCRDYGQASLSQADLVSCVQFQNQGCTVSAGACQTCGPGRKNCRGMCVDTNTNTAHCGSCDSACPSGVPCCNGRCCRPGLPLCCPDGCGPAGHFCCPDWGSCPQGTTCCGDYCCRPGEICSGGTCV